MKPLKNWDKLKRGYRWKQKTWYSKYHLGLDLITPKGTSIYAPFDGKIVNVLNGKQGGLTIWFYEPKTDTIMRFMHLSEVKVRKNQKVKQGAILALTGNSGQYTTKAHLHLDISLHKVKLGNIDNFLDPDKFNWKNKKVGFMKKEDVKKLIYHILHQIWRVLHNYKSPNDSSIKREVDKYLEKYLKGENWAFSGLIDGWYNEELNMKMKALSLCEGSQEALKEEVIKLQKLYEIEKKKPPKVVTKTKVVIKIKKVPLDKMPIGRLAGEIIKRILFWWKNETK